jgi:zinc protease
MRARAAASRVPPAVLEREKTRIIAAIKEADTKPEVILNRNFNALIYGSHPYGLRSAGEPATVATLTHDDVAGFTVVITRPIRRWWRSSAASAAGRRNAREPAHRRLPQPSAPAVIPPVPDLARSEMRAVAHPAHKAIC